MTATKQRQLCQETAAGKTAETRSDTNTTPTVHKPPLPGLLHVDHWLLKLVEEAAR